MKQISKYGFLGLVGGITYFFIEIFYRGYSHWTMVIVGALCFIGMGLINEVLSWETPLYQQALLGGLITTVLEFVTGCIVNIWLGWNVWNYANFDILGQVCLPFIGIWCVLSLVGIVLDDILRWIFFNEDKPHYIIF
jgi:uncharacterized membrane protein